jgi:hypothetical protein
MPGLDYKVYRDGELVATCRYEEEAAAIIAMASAGQIKYGGRIVWNEGAEDQPASESFDHVSEVITKRIVANHRARMSPEALARYDASINEAYERLARRLLEG